MSEFTPRLITAGRGDWTARPHWVVIVYEGDGYTRCAGHWPTRILAEGHARRLRARGEVPGVERSSEGVAS